MTNIKSKKVNPQDLELNYLIKTMSTAQDRRNAINAVPALVSMSAIRGNGQNIKKSDSKPLPTIEPSLTIEENSIVIWLRLRANGYALPERKDAISLFMDGGQAYDFSFHRDDEETIGLEVKINSELIACAEEKDIAIHYNPDLKRIAVVMGGDI